MLATARIAGIMAAKRTHELIPLCHALPLSEVTVDFEPSRDPPGLRVEATAKVDAKTGRRDGGADGGLGRLPHHLRHVQGGRPGDVLLRHPAGGKDRRPLRHLQALMALLSVAEALARVTSGIEPLEAERVALDQASGRVLAEDLAARLTQPPFDASAMDGLCGAGSRRGLPPRDAQADRRVACRRGLRGTRWPRRSGAHLHRRAGAAWRRHHRHPGECRTDRRRGHGQGGGARSAYPRRADRTSKQGEVLLSGRHAAWPARADARRRDEPCRAAGPPQAEGRDPRHRR